MPEHAESLRCFHLHTSGTTAQVAVRLFSSEPPMDERRPLGANLPYSRAGEPEAGRDSDICWHVPGPALPANLHTKNIFVQGRPLEMTARPTREEHYGEPSNDGCPSKKVSFVRFVLPVPSGFMSQMSATPATVDA